MKKKIGLIGVGLVVVAGLGLLVTKEWWSKVEKSKIEGQNKTPVVSSVDAFVPQPQSQQVAQADESVPSHEAKPRWNQEELSEAVQTLLGLDGKEHNYPELMKAIKALNKDLSAADVAALRDMLNFPNDRFPAKMRPIEINSIKNDVLDRLLRQKQLPEGLGLQMAEMASNPINDPVWRDYSIQFMGQFYERFTTESGGQKSEDGGQKAEEINQQSAIAIRQSLFSALDERSETLAGTALIGLELLSRTNEEFDRKLIVKKTVEIAADEAASPSCRLTALRLASLAGKEQGAEGMARIVDTTRRLAQTGETVLLRSAAIVTLGEVGSAADRELLDTFALSDNKQISAAAQMALKKMDSRK